MVGLGGHHERGRVRFAAVSPRPLIDSIYTLARSTEEYRAVQIHQTVRNQSIQKYSRALIPCTIVVAVTLHVLHRMRHTAAIQCPKAQESTERSLARPSLPVSR
jgi:hypothetical protein